ncbi:MAG: glutamine--fructose-6-phosphate transaminase (isomerizing) [Clostridia bacterium]|nr:glutamine--fructose-6-phosphate transaminase (isomerizing) [Clostridia bacterium]
MCGIVGYTGRKQAAPILLEGLTKLEYRGYDSAGVAVSDVLGKIVIAKAQGKLEVLKEKIDGGKAIQGKCGIGHTRWATHGVPNETNAHPHCNDDSTIVAVHNGIIENYAELKAKLQRRGYQFYSETDTEVATKLVDYYYKKYGEPLKAISEFALRVRGSYALAVMFSDYKGEIFAIRKDSPMVIGTSGGDCFLASDVPALLKYTKHVYYIENLQIAHLFDGQAQFFNLDREPVGVPLTEVTWDAEAAEKDGYEHYMLKEIHEQPRVVRDTVGYLLHDGNIDFSELMLTDEALAGFKSIVVVGCGSAYHAGVVMQYVIEDLARIPVRVELASEFRYRTLNLRGDELVIAISQSGETADTIAALREAKAQGLKTLAVVNVVGSTIAREADYVFYTKAGPEISVATTKAYSAQLIAGYLIAIKLAEVRGAVSSEYAKALKAELLLLPEKIESILAEQASVQQFAFHTMDKKDAFFIGRGIDYAVSMEGSLKLKEISYIHSEAYAAGELKHGAISLVENGTLVFGVLTQEGLIAKTVSNLLETKSRNARLAVVAFEDIELPQVCEKVFSVPRTDSHFAASLSVIPLQLYSYYLSVSKGNNVDKPRNLAKSVTVE